MRKLSEIHGEEAMDLIALLISIGSKVTSEKSLKKYLSGKPPKGMSREEFSDQFTGEFFNTLLVKYRDDCVLMLSKIEGVSKEEYLEGSDIMKITADLGSLTSDSVFTDLFFASAQSRISGSASGDTAGQK